MRIVLVNPYSPALSWFFYAQGMATPPFGMVRLGTRLQRRGHQVTVIDGQATYEPHEATLRRVLAQDPEVVGIGTTPLLHLYTFMSTSNLPYHLGFAERLRSAGFRGPALVGGTYASLHPARVLAASQAVDGVLCGDGLGAMDAVMKRLARGGGLDGIPGLTTRATSTPGTPCACEGDCLPDLALLEGWPDDYGVDEDLFLGPAPRRLHPVLPILTALGCPHDCTFCATPRFFGRRFSPLRLPDVLAWVESQAQSAGIHALSFWDDTLTVSPRRLRLLCDWLETADWHPSWWAFGRTEWVLRHPGLVARMADAGLKMMWLGVESSDPGHLSEFGRPASFAQAKQACALLLDHGVLPTTSFIIGAPEATRVLLMQDLERAAELYALGSVNVFTLMIPVPGTPIHARLAAEGRLLSHDLRLYAGTRAVIRYPDLDSAEVEEIFFHAYRDSILGERFLGQVGRIGMWRGPAGDTPACVLRWAQGFDAEVARARALDREPLPPAVAALGAVTPAEQGTTP